MMALWGALLHNFLQTLNQVKQFIKHHININSYVKHFLQMYVWAFSFFQPQTLCSVYTSITPTKNN